MGGPESSVAGPLPVTPRRRWPARVAAVLGTAALLGAGVAIAAIVSDAVEDEPEAGAATLAPTATPEREQRSERRARQPERERLTAAQRRARRSAASLLGDQGFRPVRLADYDPKRELRVLIGRPAADPDGGRRAFFFVLTRFIGYDTTSASASVRVASATDRRVTLSYRLYAPGGRACCPTAGRARVRYRWDGSQLSPLDQIPAAAARLPAG